MQKTDFMIACQKEDTNRKLLITGISLQTKESGKQISYDTTHSAFIYPLSGSATISFNGHHIVGVCADRDDEVGNGTK